MRIRLFANDTALRDYFPLLRWMIFTGLTLFGIALAWHYGLFQLNDRLDQSSRSMIIRGVLSVAALSAGLYFTHNVLWGCAGMALEIGRAHV